MHWRKKPTFLSFEFVSVYVDMTLVCPFFLFQAGRQTDRQTDGQRWTETDRGIKAVQAEAEADRQADTD